MIELSLEGGDAHKATQGFAMATDTDNLSAVVEAIRAWIHAVPLEDRIQQLPPDRRALYERIIKRRDEIGPIDFNIVEALRELRGDD
jgi:hypothetical protein